MLTRINKTIDNDRGIATEYVLLIVAVALALLIGMGLLATNINNSFVEAGSDVATQAGITPVTQ